MSTGTSVGANCPTSSNAHRMAADTLMIVPFSIPALPWQLRYRHPIRVLVGPQDPRCEKKVEFGRATAFVRAPEQPPDDRDPRQDGHPRLGPLPLLVLEPPDHDGLAVPH